MVQRTHGARAGKEGGYNSSKSEMPHVRVILAASRTQAPCMRYTTTSSADNSPTQEIQDTLAAMPTSGSAHIPSGYVPTLQHNLDEVES
jgi:hypothetical protein